MDRGDCSRIIDGDSAPIRERDLSAPSARELTKRIGSLRHFLRLVNGSSGGASSIDKIADEAGKPFGLVDNAVRMYLRGSTLNKVTKLLPLSGVVGLESSC